MLTEMLLTSTCRSASTSTDRRSNVTVETEPDLLQCVVRAHRTYTAGSASSNMTFIFRQIHQSEALGKVHSVNCHSAC